MPIAVGGPKPARTAVPSRRGAPVAPAPAAAIAAGNAARPHVAPGRRPAPRQLVFFTTRLALLLETGSSLNRGLAAIAAQINDREMARVTRAVQAEVEQGMPLSAALAQHPQVFDHVFVSMVRAGESAGILPAMLARQAELLHRRLRFRAAVRGALSYPLFLVVLSALVVIFMLVGIFPRFSGLLADMRAELPWTTRALLAFGVGLRRHGIETAAVLAASFLGVAWAAQLPALRTRLERLSLALPGVGGLLRQLYAGRFLLNLGTLLASRVPLLEAVVTTEGLLPRAPYARFFAELRASIEGGRGLAAAFAASTLFPPTVQEMIQTGETSGSLDRIMLRLAEFYEEEVQERLRVLLQVLEPVLLVMMGVVVAGIALSLLLPILKLSSGVH